MLDPAILAIVAGNLLTAWVAATDGWSPQMLLWPYWLQSVVIGIYAHARIRALRRFTTDGVTWNDEPIAANDATRRRFAMFFAAHYGLFHAVCLAFLVGLGASGRLGAPLDAGDRAWIATLGVGFLLAHGWSQRLNLAADLRHEHNIGALMFLPYARILPMHLALGIGFWSASSTMAAFVCLKTIADVVMHVFEHHWLRTGRLKTFRLNIDTDD